MSEAELHLLAGRLQGAKRAAAERGELRTPLPVGYLHDEDGNVIVDPDEEVSGAIAEVFTTFTQVGSAYAVVGALRERRFPQRAHGGAWAGQLRFGSLTHSRVCSILSNPAYAGAYVFGRFRSRRSVNPDGSVHTVTTELPRAQWAVLIHDHHEPYISWEQFLANEAKLAGNRTNAGARPPREGSALCQGIVLCGSCGRPMSTRYAGAQPYYECARARADHVATPGCRSVRAATVDDAVADSGPPSRDVGVVCPRQLGAVPRRLVWDNEADTGRGTRLAEGVARCASALVTRIQQLKPFDPESNGIVERANGFLETWLLPGRVFSCPDASTPSWAGG